jgi:RNA polymerase sigma factor (sigma-70 family)
VHDAEDAFQGTFLVFAHKAGSLRRPELLGPWLYGVAYRTALRVRSRAAGRHEESLTEMPAPDAPERLEPDVAVILDEELNRLPQRYRAPLVLCYLLGQSTQDAALALGCPKGTVLSRLSRGRDRLRRRLQRRGVGLVAVGFTGLLSETPAAVAEFSPSLPASAVQGVVQGIDAKPLGPRSLAADVLGDMKRDLFVRLAAVGTALLVAVIALGTAYGALFPGKPTPTTVASAKDEERLQGSWRIDEARAGESRPKLEGFPFQRIRFRGVKFTFEGPDLARAATFRLDASVTPRAIKLTFGRDYQAEVRVGTYVLGGDDLLLNLSDAPSRGRPSGIAKHSESNVLYLRCHRELGS